jgi:hypothetical protein
MSTSSIFTILEIMMNKVVKRAMTAALLLAASIGMANAWVITVTGTVGAGHDDNGTFFAGVPEANLAGQAFTLTTTVDTAAYSSQTTDIDYASNSGYNDPFSVALTLNGVTKTYNVDAADSAFGSSYLQRDLTLLGGAWDQAYQRAGDYAGDFYVQQQVASNIHSFGLDVDFDQVWSYLTQAGDTFDAFFNDGNGVYLATDSNGYYGGTISSIALNESNEVPEPTSLALIFLGLGGLVAVRRRAKN